MSDKKSTDNFKRVIKTFLENKAKEDEFFKKKFENKDKNINDCSKYILNIVQKGEFAGYEDQEIYSMAIHYYTEDIDMSKMQDLSNAKVIVNHQIELSEEEILEEKEKAKKKVFEDTYNKTKGIGKAKKPIKVEPKEEKEVPQQISMF